MDKLVSLKSLLLSLLLIAEKSNPATYICGEPNNEFQIKKKKFSCIKLAKSSGVFNKD